MSASGRLPWILALPLRALRILWLLLTRGPGFFCWSLGCWEPAWSGCHATRRKGNGRMCRTCCGEAGYHSKWRTGCELPPSALDLHLYPEAYRERPSARLIVLNGGAAPPRGSGD
jgi:hypothetical protein